MHNRYRVRESVQGNQRTKYSSGVRKGRAAFSAISALGELEMDEGGTD